MEHVMFLYKWNHAICLDLSSKLCLMVYQILCSLVKYLYIQKDHEIQLALTIYKQVISIWKYFVCHAFMHTIKSSCQASLT